VAATGAATGEATAAAGIAAAGAAAAADGRPALIRRSTLPSGVRLVTERMPEARSVAVGAYVGVGGRDEPAEVAGASHFLEHLLFKGTVARSARDLAEAIDATGGEMNAYTSREHTSFYARVPATHGPMAITTLAEVLAEPAIRPGEVEAEREVILEELAAAEDNPEDVAHTRLAEAVFPDHPLGREVLGTEASIDAMARDEIAAFHHHWYRPTNLVLAVAGAIDHDEVASLLDDFAGAGPGGELPVREAPTAPPVAEVVVRHPVEQAHLALGWRSLAHDDPDRWALALANYVLGGGTASRLFQEVREDRGLAYSVFSSIAMNADSGSLTVYAATSPSKIGEVLAIIDGIVEQLLADGISPAERALALGFIEGSLDLAQEDSGARMARLGRSEQARGEVLTLEEHLAALRAVEVDDVHRVLRRVLDSPRSLVAVGPFDSLPRSTPQAG
jgi:predicted Zn-dependent peptidase